MACLSLAIKSRSGIGHQTTDCHLQFVQEDLEVMATCLHLHQHLSSSGWGDVALNALHKVLQESDHGKNLERQCNQKTCSLQRPSDIEAPELMQGPYTKSKIAGPADHAYGPLDQTCV